MRNILFVLLCLSVVACSKSSNNSEATVNDVENDVTAADSVSLGTDAITAATSKPNEVSFNGTIVLAPQRQVTVALTMGGVVKHTSLLPGQQVTKGALLATLENPDFIALQQTYLESHAQAEFLQAEFERQRSLSDQQAASQKRFQQSQADYRSMQSRVDGASAQLTLLGVDPQSLLTDGIMPLLKVYAPISGYVSSVAMNIGRYKQAGEPLCEVIDKREPLLRLTTYEKDVANVEMGDKIEFRVNGMDGQSFRASIISIGQRVDDVNRSLEVYARVDDTHQQFRPGMYVMAHIVKK